MLRFDDGRSPESFGRAGMVAALTDQMAAFDQRPEVAGIKAPRKPRSSGGAFERGNLECGQVGSSAR